MVLRFDPRQCLPSSAELPDSDDTPVDNELQNLIPNLLEAILAMAWPDRQDWFFGVDMGIYFDPAVPAVVPDGFLSLGVERFVGERGRLSYVLWEEDNITPTLALEVVSKTYGGEYERKKKLYAALAIDYYAVYLPDGNPRRNRQPLEIYQLVAGEYQQLGGNPVWLPKIGLGLGRDRGTYLGRQREWLYWYDQTGQRLSTPEEMAAQAQAQVQQERSRAEQEKLRADRLAARLRALGIDPESV
ncbi:MAG: Uma2 family endonuclease [Cyanobacteria bacterium]|nr:Uma2 family endonuclease [Cyanobacteriota bacterium]